MRASESVCVCESAVGAAVAVVAAHRLQIADGAPGPFALHLPHLSFST